jgi:hypothetical protein
MKNISIFTFLCLAFQISFGQNTADIKNSKPFVLGSIIEMQSKVLSEKRILNIYLPNNYNEKDTVKYPVIYLLDGSADEDFIHIAGLIQFSNFPWVDILPNTILVGIANIDRRRDFTFPTTIDKDKKDFPTTGQSAKFIDFIEAELQPFIERNYRTNATKTIIGQSLGGLVATEILFKKPQLFTNYIIVSPSLWWDHESLLTVQPAILQPGFAAPASVFIAVGKEGKIMENDAKKLTAILKNGHKKNLTVNFEYFTDENHASILHNAVYNGFKKMNVGRLKK